VRPLPRRKHGPESSITRKHIIKKNRSVARGLISIIGGKLTTYRNLAEQTVDKAGKLFGRDIPACRTRTTKLPGASRLSTAREQLGSSSLLSAAGVERMFSIYGGRVIDILAMAEGELANSLDERRTVLAAEVAFAIREEFARTLTDIVHRRIMIGLDADQGRPLYESIAAIAADEFGWDDAARDAELQALIRYSDSLGV
jgi:glycerol-3-phosphate dehydrogenase